ncbi:pectate lyase A [Penicillium diatomitis]|uniref:pectate lyase n=1 Tax=Penicillium diatomitis TaxID=2819901 RepID=A0A9W9X4Q7_9EURO|nr:pectate lyase A [Penicillium diatomitis]KAJ5483843.1 pectate lyase A [Penicillium diatomitis]
MKLSKNMPRSRKYKRQQNPSTKHSTHQNRLSFLFRGSDRLLLSALISTFLTSPTKWFAVALARCLSGAVLAAPTATSDNLIVKRAGIKDAATGFASQNGGTTGGAGGTTTTTTTVSSYAAFTAAVKEDAKKVLFVSGTITQTADQARVGSNTSIIGKDSNAKLVNFGVEHNKDYYDGLIDVSSSGLLTCHLAVCRKHTKSRDRITHAADYVTVSNSYIHDHWKASLIGHSDKNGAEDTGHLHLTQNNNHWKNIHSRTPPIRFGTGHIYKSYSEVDDSINTRDAAQVLVESNVFSGSTKPLYSTDAGYAFERDNDFGAGANAALAGTLKSVPYSYSLLGSKNVESVVVGSAGQTLKF